MISGILPIHKPEGISSARVVAQVKKILGAKKVGHAGTLDPFASGLLLCGINHGTRISRFFLDGHKQYEARICLGRETDTYDLTGKTVFEAPEAGVACLKTEEIQSVVASFSGVQEQIPPAYSALKHEGQPLYKLARQGNFIQKPPRRIEIFYIRTVKIDLPYVDISVFCSAGTYIRSLGFDIGRKLGCGAHLSKLSRTQSSSFKLENATPLDTFVQLDTADAQKKILSLSHCLSFMPEIKADNGVAQKIKFGQQLFFNDFDGVPEKKELFYRVTNENNEVLAIVQPREDSSGYNYTCVFSS